jgi:glycosyltransferase involved in cell wall biosynthesis
VEGARKTRLLQEAAVLVLPSRHPLEGQPLVILEALGAGTPVVASDLGAIPDMVRDGIEGFIVQAGDVDALADRLTRLLDDRSLRAEMGRSARRRYEQEYTMSVFVRRIANLWSAISSSQERIVP